MHQAYSQNMFHSELEKDTTYRFNISPKSIDSLLRVSRTDIKDTAFQSSFGKAETIDLAQLIFLALSNNPQLKAMSYKVDAEKIRAGEYSALPDPMLEAEGDMISTGFNKVGQINFFASQMFPFPGKLALSRKSALISSEMMLSEHHNMESELINMVKMNYYNLYFVDRKLEVNHENQEILKTYSAAAEARYSVGKGMQQELFKIQIELSKLQNEEVLLKQERKNLMSNLTALTKVKLEESTRTDFRDVNYEYFVDHQVFPIEETDVSRLVDYAFQYRPDLAAIRKKILMNRTNLEMAKVERYPDFNVKLGYRILPFEENNAFNVMVGINIPFAPWASAKYDYRIQKNEIIIKSSTEEYRDKQNEIRREIQNTVNDLKSVKQTLDYTYNVLLPQTENSLKSTQYSYETGMTNVLDLLDSYRMYQEARLMFFESANMYLEKVIGLEKITGMNFKKPQ
jgi:cobalt-zinc-cadmium efflux system outer membrane protein